MSVDQTRYESALKRAEYTRDRAIQERDRAITERDALAEALRKHGMHRRECPAHPASYLLAEHLNHTCTCGFDGALALVQSHAERPQSQDGQEKS